MTQEMDSTVTHTGINEEKNQCERCVSAREQIARIYERCPTQLSPHTLITSYSKNNQDLASCVLQLNKCGCV